MWNFNKHLIKLFLRRNISRKSNLQFDNHFDICDEVKYGLEKKAPIVALESTIITHGMPYPENVKCALNVEEIIREQGAIPATIAILGGKVTVGLNKDQIKHLANTSQNKAVKTSRRDFPYVITKQLNGGTTVSATIIVAEKVGIPIFVTGGIGGVHIEGEKTLDISSDLTELGRSSIAVVCAGVKSILDIPKTLEYLETQGVFVSTFGSVKDFPAFYTRKSGAHAPYNITSIKEAAQVIKSSFDLHLKSGMLFAVPVPEAEAIDEGLIREAIQQALDQARAQDVTGKQITPFLLSAISNITNGKSLQTNMALIKNNAKIGAQIAVELSKISSNQHVITEKLFNVKLQNAKDNFSPVIIGGSVLDCCASIQESEIKLDGSLHFTKFSVSAGGVGRNICEALEKLGAKPMLLSVVGNDNHGEYLRSLLKPSSTKYVKVLPEKSTAQCTIVLDSKGDCKILLGELDINKHITSDMIKAQQELLKRSPLIVTDGNLPIETLSSVLEIADKYEIPVFYEPTDVPVAANPFLTSHPKSVHFISPNLNELRYIVQKLGIYPSLQNTDILSEARELGIILSEYVKTIFITLGPLGLMVVRKGSINDPLLSSKNNNTKTEVRYYKTEEIKSIVNVSGAGDCLASGLIYAMLNGYSENICVSVGFSAAKMALQTQCAVPSMLFNNKDKCWTEEAHYIDM